jgi:histidine ammonia-lyase
LHAIIRDKLDIELTEDAWEKVDKSRQVIDNMMKDPSKVVYGVTTGFGSFANVSISSELRLTLQVNLIRSHSVGVGRPLSVDTVRRMLILRINTLSKGRSGIRKEILRQMIDACNRGFTPRLPCQGTVGASGDLAPLAHLALGLMG